MPYPAAKLADAFDLPTSKTVPLLVDVAITPVNTFVDAVTFGTMPPGVYLINGQFTIAQITGASVVTYKVLDVAAIVAAGEVSVAIGAGLVTLGGFIINHLASGIIKVQLATTVATSTLKSIALNNGTGTTGFVSYASLTRIA